MKLKPADIDRILESNVGRPQSVNDFAEENAAARDALIDSLTAYRNQSSAREGQILPPPPKSLTTVITNNDNAEGRPPQEHQHQHSQLTVFDGESVRTQPDRDSSVPLPLPLRGADLDKIQCRADLMQVLTSNLPLNEMGLPKIIYRADLLDWRLFSGVSAEGSDVADRYKTMSQFLEAATIWLSYAEGFPTLPTGEPLWGRLPFEQSDHYAGFTDYCTMVGARELAKLIKYPLDQIVAWYHEDYWAIRAKCYDMLNAIHAARVRTQRIMAIEDDHYIQAESMLNSLKKRMAEVDWDVLVGDPKQFVDVMEKIVKLQRISLGLSSMGNADGKREVTSESLEVTMRRIAEPNLIEDKQKDGGIDVRQLLKNPDALASAQELIIKMNKSTVVHQAHFQHEEEEPAQ